MLFFYVKPARKIVFVLNSHTTKLNKLLEFTVVPYYISQQH